MGLLYYPHVLCFCEICMKLINIFYMEIKILTFSYQKWVDYLPFQFKIREMILYSIFEKWAGYLVFKAYSIALIQQKLTFSWFGYALNLLYWHLLKTYNWNICFNDSQVSDVRPSWPSCLQLQVRERRCNFSL